MKTAPDNTPRKLPRSVCNPPDAIHDAGFDSGYEWATKWAKRSQLRSLDHGFSPDLGIGYYPTDALGFAGLVYRMLGGGPRETRQEVEDFFKEAVGDGENEYLRMYERDFAGGFCFGALHRWDEVNP